MASDEPPMVIGVGISDREAAETFVSGMLEGVAPEVYGSANVYAADDATVAVADEWVLMSPLVDEVHAAIDVLDGNEPSLAEDPGFSAAFSRVPTAHLGAVYLDLQSLGALIEMGMAQDAEAFGAPMDVEAILAAAARGHGRLPRGRSGPADAGGLHHGPRGCRRTCRSASPTSPACSRPTRSSTSRCATWARCSPVPSARSSGQHG